MNNKFLYFILIIFFENLVLANFIKENKYVTPITKDKYYTTKAGKPIIIDVISDSFDDSGSQILIESIDLDPDNPGVQGVLINSGGEWIVDYKTGNIIFTPKVDFGGVTSIKYTIKNNSKPISETSTPKNITVDVTPCTSEIDGDDFFIQNGETKTFTMPPADYGFQFDIYQLDNSFNLNINGMQLATNEIQFQRKDISENA